MPGLDLDKKIGPLPAWGWGLIGAGGGGAVLYIRHKRAAAAAGSSTGTAGASPSPYTGGGTDVPDQLPPGIGAYIQGPEGPRGPAGKTGPRGPRGPAGGTAPKPKLPKRKHPKPPPKRNPHAPILRRRPVDSNVERLLRTGNTPHPTYKPALGYPPSQSVPATRPVVRSV